MHNANKIRIPYNLIKKNIIKQPNNEQLTTLNSMFVNGFFEKALIETNRMLKLFPNSSIIYQIEAAINDYQLALEISPNFVEAYNNIGVALQNSGEIELAIKNYKKAIKINPNYANSYYNLSTLYKDQGDLDQALDYSKQAIMIKGVNFNI